MSKSLRSFGTLSVSRRVTRRGRVYPLGFERAGGHRLPPDMRSKALREIATETARMSTVETHVAVQRIVTKYWRRFALPGSDETQLSYGPPTVAEYDDHEDQERARRMLVWLPTAPGFSGCLDEIEANVWAATFSAEQTQQEIAFSIGIQQGTVSKIKHEAIRKLNERYRDLREQDALPLAVLAWVRQQTHDDDADLQTAIELIQRRARAKSRGIPVGRADKTCADLCSMRVRNA